MRGVLPAACVLAVLMTAGPAVAFIDAVAIVAETTRDIYQVAMGADDMLWDGLCQPGEPACDASVLASVAVSNVIFLKNGAEAVVIGGASALAAEPAGTADSMLREKAGAARALVQATEAMGWGAAWTTYDAAYAVAAMELGALGHVPSIQDCFAALPEASPLEFQACVVAWSNAIVAL